MNGLQLKRAWVKGARRRLELKPKTQKHRWTANPEGAAVLGRYVPYLASGFAHLVSGACRIFHVADDVVVITDGAGGYMPFSVSTLRELLDEAEALPITTTFRCDK